MNERAMAAITPFDWHDDGVLWLVNRVVFHPRGFALARNPEGQPEWTLIGDGSEPWAFDSDSDDECFAAVKALLARAENGSQVPRS